MTRSKTEIYIHLVFATKGRVAVLDPSWRDELYRYIAGQARNFGHAFEIGGYDNHLHNGLSIRQDVTVAEVAAAIKARSARWMKREGLVAPSFRWQRGYGAFSVNPYDLERLRHYIRNQEQHHSSMNYEQEFDHLVETNGNWKTAVANARRRR